MKSISIPAATSGNPGVYSEANNNSVFQCISSDGACQVRLGSQAAVSCIAGLVLGTPGGPPIESLLFQNFGSKAVNLTFDTGNKPMQGAIPTAATENFFNLPIFGGSGSLGGTRALAPGAGAAIPGTQTINGVSKTRQFIEFTNFDAKLLLYVFTDHQTGPSLDQCIGAVFPSTYRRFRTPQNLVCFNIDPVNSIQCTAWEQY